MLIALTRRRSLLVAVALVVVAGGFVAPAVAGLHGHCAGTLDQHCSPALPSVAPLPSPGRFGWVEAAQPVAFSLLVPLAILKVPLGV